MDLGKLASRVFFTCEAVDDCPKTVTVGKTSINKSSLFTERLIKSKSIKGIKP